MPEWTSREKKVGEFWSQQAARRARGPGEPLVDWTQSEAVQVMINERASGSRDVDWLEWLRREFYPEGMGPALSVGCGSGGLERELLERQMCESVVGIDIADGALEAARAASAGLPVTYLRADLERDEVPMGPYDAVFAVATLHHINRLGHVAARLSDALKPGGYLFVLEYVGPSRFQWTPEQLTLVSDIHCLLPWRYRMHFQAGGTLAYPQRTPPCSMIRSDPSEAVRSSEIEGVFEQWFERVEERAVGGTLLNPLLGGILASFDEDSEADRMFIELVGALEEGLVSASLLPSDFKILVYRKGEGIGPTQQMCRAEEERAALVADQERRIAALHQSFLDLEERCEALRAKIARTDEASSEAGDRVARQVEANARLKSGWLFKLLRGSSAEERAVEPPEAEQAPEERPQEGLALFGRGDVMASPLGRAARRHADGLLEGTAVLWMAWLQEVLPDRPSRVLALGLEPWEAELASHYWALETGIVAGGAVFAPTEGPYDAVLAGESVDSKAVRAAAGRLADGGRLIVLGDDGRASDAAGSVTLRLEARAAFTPRCQALALDAVADPPSGGWDMARALAGLLIYTDAVLAGAGLLQDASAISVWLKGEHDAARAPAPAADITFLQEAEIQRLTAGVAHKTDVLEALTEALEASTSRLDGARADLERLGREREVLERGGPMKYWRLFRIRRARRAEM